MGVQIYFQDYMVSVEVGETYQLEVLFTNPNVSNKTISWEIEGGSCATVDSNGLVTALYDGSTYVKATSVSGYSCTVLIDCIISPTSISFDKTFLS